MKTNVNMIRKMGSFDVAQRTKDGFFNATELLNQWNNHSGEKKEITKFFGLENTKEFINVNNCKYIKNRGKYSGGTWVDEKLIYRIYDWATSNTIGYRFTKERLFFDTFSDIAGIDLIRQYECSTYKIDAVLIESFPNYGDYDIDKDELSEITCFEFDEKHHDKQPECDIKRQCEIVWELKDKFDIVKFFRIKEGDRNDFLRYAIPYYSNIENSYSGNHLYKHYSFTIDMECVKTFEELLNEMRRMWHMKWKNI